MAFVKFFGNRSIQIAQVVHRLFSHNRLGMLLGPILDSVVPAYQLLEGIPTQAHLYSCSWKSDEPVNKTNPCPLDNELGLIWLSPVVPMTHDHVEHFLNTVYPIFSHFGFDPLISLTAINERCLCAVMTISYNKKSDVEKRSAPSCYDRMLEALIKEGYLPYRSGIQSMNKFHSHAPIYWDTVHKIKMALDPENIMAPGRYLPS